MKKKYSDIEFKKIKFCKGHHVCKKILDNLFEIHRGWNTCNTSKNFTFN